MHGLRQRAAQRLPALPLSFEPNRGQVNRQVRFLARGSGYTLFLTDTAVVLSLGAGSQHAVLSLRPLGGATQPSFLGLNRLPGTVSYFTGSDPHSWHANIPTFARVLSRGVYPGIDLAFYGHGGRLEYDWLVHPGADPSRIALHIAGAGHLRLDGSGALRLQTAAGTVIQPVPHSSQRGNNGQTHLVSTGYTLNPQGIVRLRLGSYNHRLPLIIDPTLAYSTYLGSGGEDVANAVAVDASGSAYVAGSSGTGNFPLNHSIASYGSTNGAPAFVSKLTPAGDALEYSTFLGNGVVNGIAVDSSGDATVTGYTFGPYPEVHQIPGAEGTISQGKVFVTRLHYDPAAQTLSLVYSTLLGGSGKDEGQAIALDPDGNAYVTGSRSGGFPLVHPIPGCTGDAFAARLDYDPSAQSLSLVYSTCFGASGAGAGIAVDRFGNAYITGDIPADEPFQTTDGSTHHGGIDSFVTKLSFDGLSTVTIAYSILIGGSGLDQALGIAVDQGEDIYVGGVTESADFPTLHPYQATYAGNSDGFVVELDPNGVPLYSTYFGGSRFDGIIGVAIGNASGTGNQCVAPCDVYVTGDTTSTDFPSASPLQPNYANCITQAFVARLQLPTGLPFSTTIGGCNGEAIGDAVAVTTAGEIVLAGITTGSLPLVHPIQGTYAGGNSDAFVLTITSNPTAAVVSRLVRRRIAGRMLFTWRLAVSTNVIGFDLYAGHHRLNAHTIPVHASPVYHYGVTGMVHARYALHVLLRDGRELTVPVQ